MKMPHYKKKSRSRKNFKINLVYNTRYKQE